MEDMVLFSKLTKIETQCEGHTLTWRRAGLRQGLRGETILASLQEHIDEHGYVNVPLEMFEELVDLLMQHLLLIDGEPVPADATRDDFMNELNSAMVVKMWSGWYHASRPSEDEKKASPQP
jgi:hypothetical protein